MSKRDPMSLTTRVPQQRRPLDRLPQRSEIGKEDLLRADSEWLRPTPAGSGAAQQRAMGPMDSWLALDLLLPMLFVGSVLTYLLAFAH